jgi:DNA-binding CsgD family transcriptional regulator
MQGVAPRGLIVHRVVVDGEELALFELPLGPPRLPPTLTRADRAVAALVIDGATNAEIARRRRVSVRTVANQVASIFRKVGVGSRGELVARTRGDHGDEAVRRGRVG